MFDIVWIGAAFLSGLVSKRIGLPPLAGYLVAGFVLHELQVETGDTLAELSELGITVLLFTIGLELRLDTFLRTHVWAAASIQMTVTTLALGGLLALAAGLSGSSLLGSLDPAGALLVGFALSFSSTVFAVKFLESRGDTGAQYGRTLIGILLLQDLVAVLFLALSAGKVPSLWSIPLVVALWPAGRLLGAVLSRTGHGELRVLFGLAVAVGGAQLFDVFQIKGDLGALALGIALAQHPGAEDLAKTMLAFKDLFLVGFFLSVGLAGTPEPGALLLAAGLVLLLPAKSGLFFWLLTRFGLRSRTSTLAALGLSSYSEFGLIVGAVAVQEGWLEADWLGALSVVVAGSFVAAAPANARALEVYERLRPRLARFQRARLIPEERQIEPGPAAVLVFGLGRVGTGAYDWLVANGAGPVVGVESDDEVVEAHRKAGRRVIPGSGTDVDFWSRVALDFDVLELVVLTMPRVEENAFATRELRKRGFEGRISAVVRYADHVALLEEAGASHVLNLYREAGSGLAQESSRGLWPSA